MYKISETCQIKDLKKIYEKYFHYNNGTFVEVGAFDGETFSNTSGLADYGWKGIYIEPIESQYKSCKERHKKNNVLVLKNSIGTQEGEIEIFIGGSLTTTSIDQSNRYKEIDWSKHKSFNTSKCDQLRLETVLNRYNIKPRFDLLCVDVEGQEYDVFNSFDLEYWKPKMIIVELEDNHLSFQQYEDYIADVKNLREKIENSGYTEIYRDKINTVFIEQNINNYDN